MGENFLVLEAPYLHHTCSAQMRASVAQMVKHLSAVRETQVQSLGWEDPLEKETAAHSSTLAWKIPWTEEPGRLHSPWDHKESDMTERLHFFTFCSDVHKPCPRGQARPT